MVQPASKRLVTEQSLTTSGFSANTALNAAIDSGVASGVPTIGAQFFAPVALPVLLSGGRKWAFMGDSITAGTGAAAGRRFISYVPAYVGTAHMAPATPLSPAPGAVYSVDGGVAGERADQVLARVDAVLATGVKGMVLLAGQNDANQSRTVTQFLTSIQAIAAKCRAAGIPLVVGLVLPRGSGVTAAIRTLVHAYNLALREWAPRAGVYLADTHTPLAVLSDDTLAAAYAYDDIHPNTNGHRLIAAAVATAVRRTLVAQPLLVSAKTPLSLNRNPLFQTDATFWSEAASGTGTAPTYSRVADTTGKLPPGGYWYEMDFNNAAGVTGTRSMAASLNAGATWTAGNTLLRVAQLEIEDLGGYAAAAILDPSSCAIRYQFVNGVTGVPITTSGTGIPAVLDVSPGPLADVLVVPAGVTSLVLWLSVTIPTGVHVKIRTGATDVLNLTTAGLVGTF